MKRIYIKPVFEVVEVEFESLMTALSNETDSTGSSNETAGDEFPNLAGGRRGSWGSLWD